MNTLKLRLENILIELELRIKQLTECQSSEAGKASSNNDIILEHLKDLQHLITIAKKIIDQLLVKNLDKETQG